MWCLENQRGEFHSVLSLAFVLLKMSSVQGDQMKIAIASLMMFFGMNALAAADFSPAAIDSAVLDNNTMNVTMGLRLSNPCFHVASPQIVQDSKDQRILKVEGLARKSSEICIDKISGATQTVNLPALVEMSQIKVSKLQSYVVRFDGFEGEYVIPGSKLMISIQPQPINE